MSLYDATIVNKELSKPTSIFGLRLYVVIGIFVGAIIVLILFLLSLCITSRRRNHRRTPSKLSTDFTPAVSKEIQEIVHDPAPDHKIQIEIGKAEHRVVFSDRGSSGESRATSAASDAAGHGGGGSMPEVSHLGWGRWYTLRELEAATNGLSDENVVGEGGYGIVYHGVLADNTLVAVKNLLNNRGQAEKEFKVEVEAIGRVRHKNLVRLLGYCVEGAYRMLVYEYVDNGNLDQWLHGDVGDVSPLTWDIRVNIILGTAKGYVAPEYACTGMLNEKSDIYSFGILIMEIITGRSPVDYSRAKGEVNLVDWLKMMVGDRRSEEVVDPKLPEMPSSKALKRVLLVALKCVDPDARKRPKMGQVIHMLEADDLPFRDERRIGREPSRSHPDHKEQNVAVAKVVDKQFGESASDTSEGDSNKRHDQSTRRR
ncbi:protein kinase superfamily protein [Actinidia rufa]|uniref:non-specific serine/threonine protein kinase n=1 Tax=Actinidia rufa TaxID=165716 RepID=A0A7J0DN49_9ERIC|nr:protein kinase superfamily protein [Actinidia rufa]